MKEPKSSYDDYSKKAEDLMSFDVKPSQPKQFDFNAMGITEQETSGHIIKKAQYIGSKAPPTAVNKQPDGLIDLGAPPIQPIGTLVNKFEDLFSLDPKPSAPAATVTFGFDFDFGQS